MREVRGGAGLQRDELPGQHRDDGEREPTQRRLHPLAWYTRFVSSPLALLASIAALAAWTIWILRSGRAARWAQAIPVVAAVVAGGLELLSMHAVQQTLTGLAEANPANKASNLAEGIGRASAFAVGAWTVIARRRSCSSCSRCASRTI